MGNNSLNAAYGLSAILTIIIWVIGIAFLILCIVTLIRFCKVLGRAQSFFDELSDNNLSLAQIVYSDATNLKKIADYADDIADEVEGVKVVTEAIGYEDMSIYEDYKKGRD